MCFTDFIIWSFANACHTLLIIDFQSNYAITYE